MRYEIRPVQFESSSNEALKRLWANNLPSHDEADLEDKFQWFYRQGPHGEGRAFVIGARELSRAGEVVDVAPEVVGCAGVGVRNFRRNGLPYRVALFADLAIEKRHRSAMPALALVRSVREEVARTFDLGYGFPNAKAIAVYRRAGYQLLGEMTRYVRVLRTASYLRPYVGEDLSRVASAIVDRALAALTHITAVPTHRAYELRWGPIPSAGIDELWRDSTAYVPFACERTSAFLRWRFHRQAKFVALHARDSEDIRAYAILRAGADGTIHIADLFGRDARELMKLLVQAGTAAGAQAIAFRFLGDPRVPRMLASLGFSRRPDTRAVIAAAGCVPVPDVAQWYLTDLDEDI